MTRALLLAVLAVTVASAANAQRAIEFSVGALGSTPIVKDNVLDTKLTPAVGPMVGLGVLIPTGGAYRLVLQARVARNPVNAADATSGETSVLTTVTVVDATVMIEGHVREDIRWRVGGGAIIYLPSDDRGVFQDGSARRWLLAGGLDWRHTLAPHLKLTVGAQVDYHQFTTDALLARGYGRGESVERYSLQLGVERSF